MSGAQIIELACIILAVVFGALALESRIDLADEKIRRMQAESTVDNAVARASAAENIIRNASERARVTLGKTAFDRAIELEQGMQR